MNFWSWLNSLCLSTEGFSKFAILVFKAKKNHFQVKYCVFRALLFSLTGGEVEEEEAGLVAQGDSNFPER